MNRGYQKRLHMGCGESLSPLIDRCGEPQTTRKAQSLPRLTTPKHPNRRGRRN